jgi:3-hydroxyisobutyrate dehydrogenase-like beta-hydroxyacid dehydrogenase
MQPHTIAILSPGDMGSGVGRDLAERGFDVVTCLAGRGADSRARARSAGFRELPDLDALVCEADLVLSILPPEAAPALAREVAAAMTRTGETPPFADCNAIAPETTTAIGETIRAAGAAFIDGGIVGAAPGKSDRPVRIYASGPEAGIMAALDGGGISIRPCGPEIGRASAVKMCYAAISKGTNTLHTATLIAAEALGVGALLRDELADSAAATYRHMLATVPRLPADAARWIGEMEEIARTFEAAGVTPHFHQGARDTFKLLARTPFAAETRATIDPNRTLEQSVKVYLDHRPGREEHKAAE